MATTTTIVILLAIALFLIGLAVGWVFSNGGDAEKRNSKVKTIVALTVTAVWIVAMGADIVLTGYTVSPLVHALMGAIVGYFFTDDGLTFNFGGGDRG